MSPKEQVDVQQHDDWIEGTQDNAYSNKGTFEFSSQDQTKIIRLVRLLVIYVHLKRRQDSIRRAWANKIFTILECLSFILPKKYREEALGDLMDIVSRMRSKKVHPIAMFFTIFLHFANVVYHLKNFKLSEFFGEPEAKKKKS